MAQNHKISPREEAKEKLLEYMIGNSLKAHDKLPSERDFSSLWGVNRMTLRSAIQALITEGILYNKKGSGTFIAPEKLNRNLQDLKSFSETVKESGRTLRTLEISKRVIESNKQVSQKLCVTLGHPVLELVRVRYIDEEPVMIETTYMDYKKYKAIDHHDFSKESLYQVIETEYGISVDSGSEKISITFATEEEASLLEVKANEPLFFLTGTVLDEAQGVLEYFKTVARNDKIRFSSKLIKEL